MDCVLPQNPTLRDICEYTGRTEEEVENPRFTYIPFGNLVESSTYIPYFRPQTIEELKYININNFDHQDVQNDEIRPDSNMSVAELIEFRCRNRLFESEFYNTTRGSISTHGYFNCDIYYDWIILYPKATLDTLLNTLLKRTCVPFRKQVFYELLEETEKAYLHDRKIVDELYDPPNDFPNKRLKQNSYDCVDMEYNDTGEVYLNIRVYDSGKTLQKIIKKDEYGYSYERTVGTLKYIQLGTDWAPQSIFYPHH